MRKTLRVFMAIATGLVIILAVVAFIYRLGDLRNSGERTSGAEYSILRNALMPLQTRSDLQDRFLRDRLIALYKGSDRLLAAQVLDSTGIAAWKLPADSAYFALPKNSSARGGFSAPEGSTVVFTTPLNDGMKLSALYVTLKRSDISLAARAPLIICAVWCLVIALAIVLLGSEKTQAEMSGEIGPRGPDPLSGNPDEGGENAQAQDAPPQAQTETLDSGDSQSAESGSKDLWTACVDDESEFEADENNASGEALPDAVESKAASGLDEKPPSDAASPASPADEAPLSNLNFEESLAKLEEEIGTWKKRHADRAPLFPSGASPQDDSLASDEEDEEFVSRDDFERDDEFGDSGEDQSLDEGLRKAFGGSAEEAFAAEEEEKQKQSEEAPHPSSPPKEPPRLASLPMPLALGDSALEARLNEELGRSEKSDLSLLLIHCGVNSRTDPAALALAATLKDYIGAKELIFELYKGAFAVVLPSVELGGALKMSDDLADVLASTLNLYRDIEGDPPVFVGISARSDRNVDAYKIYREASTALHKAYSSGSSRILAFRAKME